jgi:hypothetical protein
MLEGVCPLTPVDLPLINRASLEDKNKGAKKYGISPALLGPILDAK